MSRSRCTRKTTETNKIDYSQLAILQFVSITSYYTAKRSLITSVSKSLVIAMKDPRMRLQLLGDNVHDMICAVHKSPEKNFCDHF